MRLYPDLIPHEKFHKGIWLSTPKTPWYYFLHKDRDYTLPQNPKFYSTLDDSIKPIVHLLHKNNIPTTPSCSGHFYSKEHYIPTYNSLLNNQKLINNDGVILKDDETNKNYFYQNKNYKLPWTKDEFLDKITRYQLKGVLGFEDKNKDIFYELPNKDITPIHDKGITIILTDCRKKKDCQDIWNNVHNNLSNLF